MENISNSSKRELSVTLIEMTSVEEVEKKEKHGNNTGISLMEKDTCVGDENKTVQKTSCISDPVKLSNKDSDFQTVKMPEEAGVIVRNITNSTSLLKDVELVLSPSEISYEKNKTDEHSDSGHKTPEKSEASETQKMTKSPNVTPSKCKSSAEVQNFKTPEKATVSSKKEFTSKNEGNCVTNENDTPEKKKVSNVLNNSQTNSTPKKNQIDTAIAIFKTPEKVFLMNGRNEKQNGDKTPEKIDTTNLNGESELFSNCDDEEGMISTTEQARLLIAAAKTPSKSTNKTPVKQNTPSGKRSLESSPVTPGKFKRAELITLSSPKTKRFKNM